MSLPRVLILEDDTDIIELLRSVLEPDFECFNASNGLEGLQQAVEGEPDFIICDIMMPVMDGREFVKRLRANPDFESIPVIFLSALSGRDQIRDGYELGAALYITKPIDPKRFRRNIELFVNDHSIVARPKKKSLEQLSSKSLKPERESTPAPDNRDDAPQPQSRKHHDPDLARAISRQRSSDGPARIRILAVDDDRDTCAMLRDGLEAEYDVIETHDGISAIEYAVRYKPDIFIIDGMLPRMTGYQLTVMLKKNREFFRSPIIFVSGKATPRDRMYVERLGVPHFIAKPFTIEQVASTIDTLKNEPGFAIRTDRIDIRQINLEQFQQLETHRQEASSAVERMERAYLERILRDKHD